MSLTIDTRMKHKGRVLPGLYNTIRMAMICNVDSYHAVAQGWRMIVRILGGHVCRVRFSVIWKVSGAEEL